jgi:two-component system, NarL family, sensor histidine kinase LiaS
MNLSILTRPFQRLQGRLALTYILVTLAAVFTLEAATVLVNAAALQDAAAPSPKRLVAALQAVAPQLAPYLDSDSPNSPALNEWAAVWVEDVRAIKSGESRPTLDTQQTVVDLAKMVGSDATMIVVGSDGRGLATAGLPPARNDPGFERPDDLLRTPQAQAILLASSSGASKMAAGANLSSVLPDGRTVAAAPLVNYQGHLLGALLIATTLPRADTSALPRLDYIVTSLRELYPGAPWLILVACILGSIFGLFVARTLTRRLHLITNAAASWSQGNFQAAIKVDSSDELGDLARDLNGMAEKIRSLLALREQLVVVDERNRLARDLHDAVKQQTFAIALLVGAAKAHLPPESDEALGYLTEAEALAEQTRQELTGLIYELRPAQLEHQSLPVALQEYVRAWSRRTGITAQAHVYNELDEQEASSVVAEALIRVTQEALANVARHSAAKQVEISLQSSDGSLCLTIVDDGHGFDVAQARGSGMGLTSMQERVEAQQGVFDVTSVTGHTEIKVAIPLERGHVVEVGRHK